MLTLATRLATQLSPRCGRIGSLFATVWPLLAAAVPAPHVRAKRLRPLCGGLFQPLAVDLGIGLLVEEADEALGIWGLSAKGSG